MKDVTVALELTVDESLSDGEIQRIVQTLMKKAIKAEGQAGEIFDDILVDVKAITDGIFVDFTQPEWRVLEYTDR